MAETLVKVLPKTDYVFTSVGATPVETVIAQAVDVTPYTSGVLVARVHAHTTTGSQSIDVLARNTAPSPDDPSFEFTGASAIATASLFFGPAGPLTTVSPLNAGFASFIKIVISASQTTQNNTFTASVSVDLLLRE